ncbi:helix-turn-helix domain-containing protein [Streptomyces sp. NBC_00258]|uniref:helix-turn-helix domain-containing protein n=1 Tax=Streptomyces sp. NBC_00258 TaxID=2903642 RepID=UPI003FA7795B
MALHRAASGVSGETPTPTSSEGSDLDTSEILGAHEVADLLGCSRRWATALLGSGRIRAWQAGRTWVTTRGDLDRYRFEEPAHGNEEDHPHRGRQLG